MKKFMASPTAAKTTSSSPRLQAYRSDGWGISKLMLVLAILCVYLYFSIVVIVTVPSLILIWRLYMVRIKQIYYNITKIVTLSGKSSVIFWNS